MLSNKNTIKVQNKPQNEGSDEAQYSILATIFWSLAATQPGRRAQYIYKDSKFLAPVVYFAEPD